MTFTKGQAPWNKNLTKETDLRVARYSKKLEGNNPSVRQRKIMSEAAKNRPPVTQQTRDKHSSSAKLRGFGQCNIGKKQSEETKKKRGETLSRVLKGIPRPLLQGKIPKNLQVPGQWGNIKRGWFDVNGKRMFFRSTWEVNYALYLDFLITQKQIKSWEYEVDTFWFENIKRGVRSYLPDFKVFNNNGTFEYHEVKGYMDPKSITKLKRMAKYHPSVKMVLIGKDEYKELKQKIGRMAGFYE